MSLVRVPYVLVRSADESSPCPPVWAYGPEFVTKSVTILE